jgi:hypothetical protein
MGTIKDRVATKRKKGKNNVLHKKWGDKRERRTTKKNERNKGRKKFFQKRKIG